MRNPERVLEIRRQMYHHTRNNLVVLDELPTDAPTRAATAQMLLINIETTAAILLQYGKELEGLLAGKEQDE